MLGNIREYINKTEPEEKKYFKNKLGKKSKGFLMLERLVKETDGKKTKDDGPFLKKDGIITWEKLKKYTKIEAGKVEGIYWEDSLLLRYVTSLGKLKKVGGYIDLYGVSSLKDIGELEEIGGYFNIMGISIELQVEAIRKIEKGELVVNGEFYYDEIAIEQYFIDKLGENSKDFLLLQNFINKTGYLITYSNLEIKVRNNKIDGIFFKTKIDLQGKTVEQQEIVMNLLDEFEIFIVRDISYDNEVVKKYFKKKLGKNSEGFLLLKAIVQESSYKIEWNDIKKHILIKDKSIKLDFKEFEKRYGAKVNKIEGEQQEQIRQLLEYIQKVEKEDLSKGIVKILKENITEEEKKEKIAKLNDEYKVYIRRIDEYL